MSFSKNSDGDASQDGVAITFKGRELVLTEETLENLVKGQGRKTLFDGFVDAIKDASGLNITCSKSSGRPMLTWHLNLPHGVGANKVQIFGKVYVMVGVSQKHSSYDISSQIDGLKELFPLATDSTGA